MLVSSFCASRLSDATRRMRATELLCAAPSQQRLRRGSSCVAARSSRCSTTTYTALNWSSHRRVAAPRGGTRRQLEEGRKLHAESAPSQQQKQATAVSRDHERSTGRKTSSGSPSTDHRAAPRRIIGQPLDGSSGSLSTDHRAAPRAICHFLGRDITQPSSFIIHLRSEKLTLRSLP